MTVSMYTVFNKLFFILQPNVSLHNNDSSEFYAVMKYLKLKRADLNLWQREKVKSVQY